MQGCYVFFYHHNKFLLRATAAKIKSRFLTCCTKQSANKSRSRAQQFDLFRNDIIKHYLPKQKDYWVSLFNFPECKHWKKILFCQNPLSQHSAERLGSFPDRSLMLALSMHSCKILLRPSEVPIYIWINAAPIVTHLDFDFWLKGCHLKKSH